MSLDKRSIELGTEGWGVKEDNLLAFRKDRTRYVEKPFTFSRGTGATRVNSSGSVEILHDEATNLLLQSNQFDTTWGTFNSASVNPGVDDPFGGNNAWELDFGESSDARLVQSITISIGTTYTFSIWARVTSGTKIARFSAVGTLQQKTLTTDWQRIEITGTANYTSSGTQIRKLNSEGDYTIQIYGAQLETGYFATPYIETTTQAVTQPNKHETPRISYDIVDGVVSDKPHLLLEPARINIFENSQYITGNIQTSTGGLLPERDSSVQTPDGLANADKMVRAIAETRNYAIAHKDITVSSGQPYSLSCYFKAGTSKYPALSFYLFDTSEECDIIYDLENETTHRVRGNGNGRIENVGNGWYRCSLEGVSTTTDLTGRIGVSMAQDATNFYWTLDANNNGLYYHAFGLQFEQGSYATSYIPTFGTSVTRASETANNCGAAQDFNDDEGVLFAEILGTGDNQHPSNIYNFVSINNGLNNHNIVAIGYREDTKKFFIVVRGGNTTSFVEQNLDFEFNKYYRIALKYKSGNSSIFINGDKINDYTQTFSITGLTKLSFDYGGVDYTAAGLKTKEIKVYPETLNDAELRLLTKYAPKDYDAAFTADYVDSLAEFTVLRTEATDKLYYVISDGTNNVSGSATITATEVTISNIDISSLNDGTLTLSVYIEDERKQRGVTVTDTTIKDTTNTPLYSYALQQRATGATFEDLDNSESIIESLNVEV